MERKNTSPVRATLLKPCPALSREREFNSHLSPLLSILCSFPLKGKTETRLPGIKLLLKEEPSHKQKIFSLLVY